MAACNLAGIKPLWACAEQCKECFLYPKGKLRERSIVCDPWAAALGRHFVDETGKQKVNGILSDAAAVVAAAIYRHPGATVREKVGRANCSAYCVFLLFGLAVSLIGSVGNAP